MSWRERMKTRWPGAGTPYLLTYWLLMLLTPPFGAGNRPRIGKGVKPEIGIRTVRNQQAAPICATAANLRFAPFTLPVCRVLLRSQSCVSYLRGRQKTSALRSEE